MTSTQERPSTTSSVEAECEGILQKHARSFSAAAVFLTKEMRKNAAVCYAFCRIVDDAVDEAKTREAAHDGLARISAMLRGETPKSPIVAAYCALMHRTEIGLSPALQLIEGARSDLEEVRVRTDEEFLEYCYRVAGTVGLMMCGVLGVRDPDARRHAIDLGIGMQMTNICRDVLEDAQRDRVYLPKSRLDPAGVEQEALARVGGEAAPHSLMRHAVASVVRDVLVWADTYYASGAAGFRFIPVRARLAIIIARALYRDIGRSLRIRGFDALSGRAFVSFSRKLILTVQGVAQWMFSAIVRPASPLVSPIDLRLPTK